MIMKLLVTRFSGFLLFAFFKSPNIFLLAIFPNTVSPYSANNTRDQVKFYNQVKHEANS